MIAATVVTSVCVSAHATTQLLNETFDTDPVAGGRASVVTGDSSRLTYAAGDQTLTAAYDSRLAATKLYWELAGGKTLTQDDSFGFDVRFKINSTDFFADPNGFASISFGLVNSATTGNDRTGSLSTSADTFDMVVVDYFPNISNSYPSPSIQTNVFGTDDGNPATDAFAAFATPTTLESALNGVSAGESDVPRDVFLTASMAYDATSRIATLRLLDASGSALNINGEGDAGPGGLDGLDTTIQTELPDGLAFATDRFALLLWEDGWEFGDPASVEADITFDSISVTQIPEPASAMFVAFGLGLAIVRRHRSSIGR